MVSSCVTITPQLICTTRKYISIELSVVLYVASSSVKSRADPEIWKVWRGEGGEGVGGCWFGSLAQWLSVRL